MSQALAAAADFAHHVAQWLAEWLREAIAWIVLALAGGTLFALKRGTVGLRAWIASLLRSCIVGVLAAGIIASTDWGRGWQWVAIAFVAFGSDAILILADAAWKWAAANPTGIARTLYEWLVNRRIVVERRPPESPAPPDDKEGG